MTLSCNAHNGRAKEFYLRRGGKIVKSDTGNARKIENQLDFIFEIN